MFNLLMSGNDEAFISSPWKLEKSRVGEHTEDVIRVRYNTGDKAIKFAELIKLPTVFCYEHHVEKDAKIGWIESVTTEAECYVISFKFDPILATIPHRNFWEISASLGIAPKSFERNRTHWAIKDVDLFPVLQSAGLVDASRTSPYAPYHNWDLPQAAKRPSIQVSPEVFSIPSGNIEADLVAVMMPFGGAFDGVYHAIQVACTAAGFRFQRVDDMWENPAIIQDIFSLIYRSSVVICDFSQKNPNVFYEAGIAHTLGRTVIPLTQSSSDIPFDVAHIRHISYLNNGEGLAKMSETLASRLRTLRG